jgi:hypothetical protein
MRRKGVFSIVLALPLIVIVFVSCIAPTFLGVGAQVTFTATELLGRPTDTSVTVNVVPSSNGQVYFRYGTASGVYIAQTSAVLLTSGTPADVVIQGLAPNTRYYYQMVSSSDGTNWGYGAEHSFQTQRSLGSTFTFTVTSDSHVNIILGNAATWTQTMNNVASDHPDFEIDLGDTFAMDNVNTASAAEQAYLYQRQFFDIVGNSAPVFLAVGNHEQQEAWHLDDTGNPASSQPVFGVNAEKKYYLNPVPDTFYSGNTDPYSYIVGDHLREDYYAWRWGDALFVVIDPYWYTTTKPFTGTTGGGESSDVGSGNRWDWTLGLQQFNWLKATLEGSNAKFKFVFAHHMTGGSDDYVRGGAVPAHLVEWGGYDENGVTWGWDANRPVAQWGSEPIKQIMIDAHVSVFFHGHDHQYAYEIRDGVVYQSLPSAGFSGNGFNIYSVGTYTLKVLPSPGHLRVTVTPTQANVDYVTCAPGQGTNGQVAYSYSIAANSINIPPVAYDQAVSTGEDTPATINLAASDADGDTLSYQIVTPPTHGSLSGIAPQLAYTPNHDYSGPDSFTFKANDGLADSNIATVTVTVISKPEISLLLTTVPNQASYTRGQPVTLTVTVFNQLNLPLNSTLTLTVIGSDSYSYFDFQKIEVAADTVGEFSFNWNAPNIGGTYMMEVGLVPTQLTGYDASWLKVT